MYIHNLVQLTGGEKLADSFKTVPVRPSAYASHIWKQPSRFKDQVVLEISVSHFERPTLFRDRHLPLWHVHVR